MTTDYLGIPTPREEEAQLAATEALLPLKENNEGIWFRCPSPCWRIREEWKQATHEERDRMEKYYCLLYTSPSPRD